MRSLYLVRHGKPQYPDEHSYCVGQTDFSLSCLLYTSPSPRDYAASRMPSSA